jgi:hypothetical protein
MSLHACGLFLVMLLRKLPLELTDLPVSYEGEMPDGRSGVAR